MRYFNYEEFDSPDIQGSGQLMDKTLLNMLDTTRELYNRPIVINSGYRTLRHNSKVGGTSESSHLKGLAVDIAVQGSRERGMLLHALRTVGFTRIGIGKTFIHVDIDPDKDQSVTWLYTNK